MGRVTKVEVKIPEDYGTLMYLAGVIDGEGCLTIAASFQKQTSKNKSYSGLLDITNTDARLIRWLVDNFGGSPSLTPRKGTKAHWKPVYHWRLHSENAYRLIKAIRPYLIIKAEQADILIALWELRSLQSKGRGTGTKGSVGGKQNDPAYVEASAELHEKVLQLNKRNAPEEMIA